MKKIKKYFEYIQTLVYRKKHESKAKYYEENIKYMFEHCKDTDKLIVVFSACTRAGIPARYNYVRTLKNINCNKLFILDDLGEDKRGSYYLGRYPEYNFEKAVEQLLNNIIKKYSIKEVVFCGSSKGGYAALNFGIKYNQSIGKGIIIGAPQFWLGQYLSAPANETTLNGIKGEYKKEEVVLNLDNHLESKIKKYSDEKKQNIYIHFSENDHTYKEHIVDLCSLLENYGYKLLENREKYENHGDVSLYFPSFMIKTLNKIWEFY